MGNASEREKLEAVIKTVAESLAANGKDLNKVREAFKESQSLLERLSTQSRSKGLALTILSLKELVEVLP